MKATTMTKKPMRMPSIMLLLVALAFAVLSVSLPVAEAVRGQTQVHRSLKKNEHPDGAPAPAPQTVLESAFGEGNQKEEEEEEVTFAFGYPDVGNGRDEDDKGRENDKDIENDEKDNDEQEGDVSSVSEQHDENDNDEQEGDFSSVSEHDGKDNDEQEGDFPSVSFVKLPELALSLGVEVTPSNRAGESTKSLNNHAMMEDLVEEYFEILLPKEVMGSNYVSCDLEATMSWFGVTTGRSFMDFKVKGRAEYQGEPVPKDVEIKEGLVAFFIDWGFDNDLGTFLANNGGPQGARATNFYVDGLQMPAFVQSPPSVAPTTQVYYGSNVNNGGSDTTTSSTTATSSNNADASSEEEPSGGGKNLGLILGLTLFFLSLLIAGLLMFSTRRELVGECGSWCKAARHRVCKKKRGGWHGFEEEGSDTAADLGIQPPVEPTKQPKRPWTSWFQRKDEEDETKQPKRPWTSWSQRKDEEDEPKQPRTSWFQRKDEEDEHSTISRERPWKKWFHRNKDDDEAKEQSMHMTRIWTSWLQRRKREEEPSSAILREIEIVVDNDHVLSRRGGGHRNHPLPEDASGAIVSHQHSAATVPIANYEKQFDQISPQKTLNTCTSDEGPSDEDEVSLEDPVVRWAPPTRSTSRLYRERREPWETASTASSRHSNISPPDKRTSRKAPAPTPLAEEIEADCMGLGDWATFLNPCMLPTSLHMFQYESERLDDLVANLPRDKSVLDRSADTGADDSSLPTRSSAKPVSYDSSSTQRSGAPRL